MERVTLEKYVRELSEEQKEAIRKLAQEHSEKVQKHMSEWKHHVICPVCYWCVDCGECFCDTDKDQNEKNNR